MKKLLFFFSFSLFLTSCATNGCIGKGYGSATEVPEKKSHLMVYRPVKKEPQTPTIVKNRTENKKGLRSSKGAKPPKPQQNYANL